MTERFGRRCASLACWATLLAACAGHHEQPPSTDIDEVAFRDDVRVLASEDFQGRAPGTPGEDKSVAFLVAQFKKLGLRPGNADSYVQPVPLTEIAVADASLTVAGRDRSRTLELTKDVVIWTKRAVSTMSVQSELVFVGYGIVAPEFQWNDYANVDVRGKIVLALLSDPGHDATDPRLFKGTAMTAYGRMSYKVEEAARQGAAGVLLIHDHAAQGYGWTVVVNTWSRPQLVASSGGNPAPRAAVEGWLTEDAARGLFVQAGLDFGKATGAAARPGFKPIALGLKVDVAMHNTLRNVMSTNVMAVLPGGARKKEYVVYTSHWDSLGRALPPAPDATLSGAVDGASGVAGMLVVAQSLSRTRPVADRSILFVAFTATEAGLLGSTYYVDNPPVPLRDTAGILNLDSLHIGGPTRDVMIFGMGNSELEEYLRQAALVQGRVVRSDSNPALGLFFASDNFTFVRRGIPALYAKFGTDDSAFGPAWGQAQMDDYRLHRYHQPTDKYSPDWDVRGTLDDLRLYYQVGNQLARTRHFPRWYPNSEYRSGHGSDQAAAD